MSVKRKELLVVGYNWSTFPNSGRTPFPRRSIRARAPSLHSARCSRNSSATVSDLSVSQSISHSSTSGRCEAAHVDIRITSSNGETQRRYVIKTPLKIGGVEFRAEISLADRRDMRFPMLIGRSSLRRRFVVDSGYSGCRRRK